VWDRGSLGISFGVDSLGAGSAGPQPEAIVLPPAREHGRLGGQSGVTAEKDIRHFCRDGDRPSPGCDVSLQVGVGTGPDECTWGQTQPRDD